VPAVTRNSDFRNKQSAKKDVLAKLEKQAPKFANTAERALLCFACDPYQPLDDELQLTRKVIEILKANNIPFQTLTKGGTRAVRDFDLYGPKDALAVTLTFLDRAKSRHYEPNAAIPESRILSLEIAKHLNIETWVSLEPVIEPAESLEIIKQTHRFVDLYKIGKMNHAPAGADKINWRQFGKKAIELCREHKTDYYIKSDLAKYLDGITFCNVDNRKVTING